MDLLALARVAVRGVVVAVVCFEGLTGAMAGFGEGMAGAGCAVIARCVVRQLLVHTSLRLL